MKLPAGASAWCAVLVVTHAPLALAQEVLLPSTSWGASPIVSAWHFATPIVQPAGAVTDVRQVAFPLHGQSVLGGRWTLDASAAASASAITVRNGGDDKTLTLNGLTDVKARLSGAVIGDQLVMTAGVNLPTGTTTLNADQTSVLQVVGAPALRMPVGSLGIGPGVTVGFVDAQDVAGWALAVGGSFEHRSEYTPIELTLASGSALTRVTPGGSAHVVVGGDGALGEHRLSLLALGDVYSMDHLTVGVGTSTSMSEFRLGPQLTVLGRLDLAAQGWREASSSLSVRHRSAFSDAGGTSVVGSGGTYVEGAIIGIRGEATGRGVILGIDARYHTGLPFTDALVGSAVRAAGVTIGVELPSAGSTSRLALRAQYGQLTAGSASSNALGWSIVYAVAARGVP